MERDGSLVKKRSLLQNRNRIGFLFVTPWLIGIILFFVQTIVNLFRYSLCDLEVVQGQGFVFSELSNGIFTNYIDAFTRDAQFPQILTESLSDMLYRIPIILVFSLVVAIILNQEFKGRGVMRTVFFIPLLISCGVIASIIKTSLTSTVMSADASDNLFNTALLTDMLYRIGMPDNLVNTLGGLVANVTDLVWQSSVQIIVFIMGLMTIPISHYEVAKVEGATAWETFWFVTFPAVFPYIFVNLIYTIIDHFVSYDNAVMIYIMNTAYKDYKYSYASAMCWIYFVIIIATLGVMTWGVNLISPNREKRVKA